MDLTEYYDKLYRDSTNYHGGHGDLKSGLMRFGKIKRLMAKYLPSSNFPRWKILDVGCSTGDLLSYLKPDFFSVSGIDISRTAISRAKERGLLDVHAADIENNPFPFPDNSFNLIFSLEIFEHMFGIEKTVSEIRRVLVPGGYLFASVPNDVLNWRRRMSILFGHIPFEIDPPISGSHVRHFSAGSLSRSLNKLGFDTVVAGGFPLSYGRFDLGLAGRLAVMISPDWFSSDYFVIAKSKKV